MFIDSHCHLDRVDLVPYGNEISAFLDEAKKDQLDHMLCVSINWEDYPAMCGLVANHSQISISVGVHPNEIEGHDPSVQELVDAAIKDGAVAIGETGLDYFRLDDTDTEGVDIQRKRFSAHIQAAKQLNKPIIVHTRSAKEDTLALIRDEAAGETGGVLHCFTEDWDMAKRALDMNFYISFSGIVTFKNAKQIQEVAKKVPADRFLIETDSPYLAPVPMRGKQNYPNYVRYVADKMAELRGVSVNNIADVSCRNYNDLFNR
ncbi:MAG: deoxyribonuclease [Cycloclasticus sp. symbiont of Poecilosclerida sp. M]|nr:MAG: deoxyribonuclease [Cycloclasticus sp. symbiont of Poecilosclerida sp. M]